MGLKLGKQKGRSAIPDQDLAWSTELNHKKVPTLALDLEEALAYLRKATWPYTGQENGWVLATYKGQALGWVKTMPNRINNYYPKEYRIQHL